MADAAARPSRHGALKASYLLAGTVTGLLSSSCCAIQLILNAFSISCAGFSILDPYRPAFLFLTSIVNVSSIWKYGLTRRTFTALLISGLLSGSPELLKLYNEGSLQFMQAERGADVVVFELEMAGLSCQACANKVKLQIEKHDGVLGCEVFLKEMKAVVRSRPGTFPTAGDMEALVQSAGSRYRARVVNQYSLSRVDGAADGKVEL